MSGPGKGADAGAWSAARELVAQPREEASVDALIALAERSKAARRGVAAAVDESPHRDEVRAALAGRAGEDADGSTERLLRRARRADAEAQIRRNPIHRNEAFRCARCGHEVPAAPGGFVRNHCPRCLCSLHVDGPVPGDRASDCHGLMVPTALDLTAGAWVEQRCQRCGHERRNRLHPEWEVDPDAVDSSLVSATP